MTSEFDHLPERRGTGSLKWDVFRNAKREVLPFWVADMDFVSPLEILEAISRRVAHGCLGYAVARPEDRDAVLGYLRGQHRIEAEPSWLVWLPGLVPAKSAACRMAKLLGGGSALTCTPVYPPFLTTPADGDLECLTVPLSRGEDGLLTFDFPALEQAVRPDSRIFLLCNPHNPVGRVYRREELERLVAFCQRHDLILCADEIHCDLILEEEATPHVSALHLGYAKTVALFAASKTYNIAGLGCAYAIIPEANLREVYRRACGGFLPPTGCLSFVGTTAAYTHGEPWRQRLLAYLRGNRELVLGFFREHLPTIPVEPIAATYLAWLDVRALGLANPLAYFQEHGIGLSNGVDFGAPGYLRLNFGCPRALLQEGLARIKAAAEQASLS